MPRRPHRPWWRRIYDVALRAFPASFREVWADDMRASFASRVAERATAVGGAPLRLIAREVGNVLSAGLRERFRGSRRPGIVHSQDVRYAFRLLARSPGFTLLTIIVLAGGLGLSTFTFSFLYTAMIRPLPLSGGAQIVRIDQVIDGRHQAMDAADAAVVRASLKTIRNVGGFGGREVLLGHDGDRRVVDATMADPALFTVARTPAYLGRTLIAADAAPGAEPVIVLSYRTWEVVFGADRAVVGAQVAIDGVSTRVVGVMPPGFGFPVASEAWMSIRASTLAATTPGLESLLLIGRLAPGVSRATAAAEATVVLQRTIAARDTSVRRGSIAVDVQSLPSAQFGEERALLFMVLNLLATLILLLALVNVTNLLLARANERIRETAVRLALGASTGRLVMQEMWETMLLCVAGGALGTAGAAWGLSAITRWTQANLEGNLAFWWVWRPDRITLFCAGAFVTVAIVVLGSVVSVRTTRTNVREVMQDGGARTGSRHVGRLSRLLVATQVTTVTVLMFFGVMAGVIARRVVSLDPGFETTRLLQSGVMPPAGRYPTAAARGEAYRSISARLAEQPAIEHAILRRTLADQRSEGGRFTLRDDRQTGTRPSAFIVAALGDFATIGVRVIEGRALASSDDASHAPVAMVSRSLAARLWRGRSPVGDQLRLAGAGDTTRFLTIVGVASDVPYGNPLSRDRSPDAIYVPLLQTGADYSPLIVRYRTSEVAARQALMEAFGQVDPLLIPDGVQPFEELLRKTGLITTSLSKLFAACFAFALVLALAGTFGLMSRAIGLRTREIGVRRALGATDGGVTRLLLLQGARQLGIGALAAAPVLAVVGAAFMHFFPIGGWITMAAAAAVPASIVAAILGATWVPARAVLRVELRDALWRE
jgi:predicted permease